MPKKLSLADLPELAAQGYDIEPVPEEQLDLMPLVAQLKAIAEKQTDNTELLAAVYQLTDVVRDLSITVKKDDLKPILDAIRNIRIQAVSNIQPPKPQSYHFEVVRNNRDLIESVKATPIND